MKITKARCIITVISLLSVISLSAFSAKQQSAEAEGYSTPEKAVSAYLDGFKKMDLEQMMGTFVIDTYADNYDLKGQLERLGAYTYGLEIKLPNATPLAEDLNIESRRAHVSTSILKQYAAISSLDFNLAEPQSFKDEGDAGEFTDQFNRKLKAVKTDTIKLLGFIPPEELSNVYTADKNLEIFATRAKLCGADKIEGRAAVFELKGKAYLMCVEAANYGGKWYILELGGNVSHLLGMDAMSVGLAPVSGMDWDIEWKELIEPAS